METICEFILVLLPPTYHAMQNDLSEKCYAHVKEHVQRVTLSNKELFGCMLVSNKWSNVQRKPLINTMIVSSRGETFVWDVDSHDQIKFGWYIGNVIPTVIKEVCAKKCSPNVD